MLISRRSLLFSSIGIFVAPSGSFGRADHFRTFRFSALEFQISLHWKDDNDEPFSSLAAVKRHLEGGGRRVHLLTNAGIFSQAGPIGLHIEAGRRLMPLNSNRGEGNFYWEPNGVFYIANDQPNIIRTQILVLPGNPDVPGQTDLAIQSGPLLFDRQGVHEGFDKSRSTFIRNAVGVTDDSTIVFAISTVPVTFMELTQHFLDQKCYAALYLDGAISQLWALGDNGLDPQGGFAGIIAVTSK
jgi:uncharacterized protein YigE (DUF2233 family)